MTNWREVFGYRIEPESEFDVGDEVRILSKSVGGDIESFEEHKGLVVDEIWTIDYIHYVGSERWNKVKNKNVFLNEIVYVIEGNWFLARDLEKLND